MSTGNIHILNADYSRYGVSVYDQLYGRGGSGGEKEPVRSHEPDGFKKRYKSLMQGSGQWRHWKQKQKRAGPKSVVKAKAFLGRLQGEKRRQEPQERETDFANINCLPEEIICRIIDNLGEREEQLQCLYVSWKWSECAKRIIYRDVSFTSTYRVGQFVTTLRKNNDYGKYVDSIDLSQLKNGFVCLPESTEAEEAASMSAYGVELPEFAYAGWRDWRYRNNSLYGSHMLSSINHTRGRRGSDISSTHSSIFSNTYPRGRSGSTTSIVSKTTQGAGNKNVMTKIRRFFSSNFEMSSAQQEPLHEEIDDERSPSSSPSLSPSSMEDKMPKNSSLPYTNKFLLKYAHLRDLPIGYILHILRICVNLRSLKLSNLMISPDFQIEVLKYKRSEYISFFPEDQEEAYLGDDDELTESGEPRAKYFSDSDKPYHHYKDQQADTIATGRFGTTSENYNMFTNKYTPRKKFQLKMLTNDDLCDAILSLKHLRKLEIGNVVWLVQRDMKRLISQTMFKCLQEQRPMNEVYMNFEGSGLQTTLPLAGQGPLDGMVALIILNDIMNNRSDEEILEWFELRWVPVLRMIIQCGDQVHLARASEQLNYKVVDHSSNVAIPVREISILNSTTGQFSYLVKIDPVSSCLHLRIENGTPRTATDIKLKQCTDMLLERVNHLREGQLLQHTGENFLSAGGMRYDLI